jgi:hypothetical protein
MHSIYYKYSPSALHDTWILNAERDNEYSLRNANNFYIQATRYEHIKKLPYFALPRLWNSLDGLKLETNPLTFKIECKRKFADY